MKIKFKLICILIYIIDLCYCNLKVFDNEINRTVGRFLDADARFGRTFEDGAQAYLIESNPILGCNDTIDPPKINLANNTNIMFVALIKRGNCTFEHKVRSAQKSGYHGAIIYNNDSDRFWRMPPSNLPDPDPVYIPSRMVGLTSGHKLKRFTFKFQRQQYIVIFNDDSDFNPQYYIIAFLAFVSLGFLIIGIGFAAKLCRDWIKKRANRLKKCHLKRIPIKKFVKGKDNFETCAICLEDFMDGDKLRILPCNHGYHIKCIDPWLLKQKRNCPICKSRIKIPGRDEDSDDSSVIPNPTETIAVVVDEHTPLIHERSGEDIQSYFSHTENNVNFAPETQRLDSTNCYDNPCIDSLAIDVPVEEHVQLATPIMSINGCNEIHSSLHHEDVPYIAHEQRPNEDLNPIV